MCSRISTTNPITISDPLHPSNRGLSLYITNLHSLGPARALLDPSKHGLGSSSPRPVVHPAWCGSMATRWHDTSWGSSDAGLWTGSDELSAGRSVGSVYSELSPSCYQLHPFRWRRSTAACLSYNH